MDFRTFDIDGPVEVLPKAISDHRGYFCETYRLDKISPYIGDVRFVQANESLSAKVGTIRGIHFQTEPMSQGKLVRCTHGSAFDVAVDLRPRSPTFGRWLAVVLTRTRANQLWIPEGFGHGFCTLEPNTVISYWVTNYYSPSHDDGIAWNDPTIGIDWPSVGDTSTLSAKDQGLPLLNESPSIARQR